MLNKACFKTALCHVVCRRDARIHIALFHQPTCQHVVRFETMEGWRTARRGCNRTNQRLFTMPSERNIPDCNSFYRHPLTHQSQHSFTTIAHMTIRQYGLVLKVRVNSKGVFTRHVTCRKNPGNPRVALQKRHKIAQCEPCLAVGRAYNAQPERTCRCFIRTKLC